MRYPFFVMAAGVVVLAINAGGPRESGGYWLGGAMIAIGLVLAWYVRRASRPEHPPAP